MWFSLVVGSEHDAPLPLTKALKLHDAGLFAVHSTASSHTNSNACIAGDVQWKIEVLAI